MKIRSAGLVDVRSPQEFTGEILAPPGLPETCQRGGHIARHADRLELEIGSLFSARRKRAVTWLGTSGRDWRRSETQGCKLD